MEQSLTYYTRDGEGNDIVKQIPIKQFPVEEAEYVCPICRRPQREGCRLKKIVSGHFTDFAFVGEYICPRCSRLFSLYPYSYIEHGDEIRLLNVRQLRDELCREQPVPFRFVITTTQKKHLFYRSRMNYGGERFAVNLETETIYTTVQRMRDLFLLVETMQALGAGKKMMQEGTLPFPILQKLGLSPLEILRGELEESREIQIPLFCGQKPEITEEEALCNWDSKLITYREQRRR
jgi:hypothetical protein